jgi:hypothetical protein
VGARTEEDRSNTATLLISDVSYIHDSQLDVKVINNGLTDVIITSIGIMKKRDLGMCVSPILMATAIYKIPVDDIKVGAVKKITASQLVKAREADRFLIALETTCAYDLRLILDYNDGRVADFDFKT